MVGHGLGLFWDNEAVGLELHLDRIPEDSEVDRSAQWVYIASQVLYRKGGEYSWELIVVPGVW